jgi:hypothetical protein
MADDVSGNTVVIQVNNATGSSVQVGSLDFYIQIDSGGPKLSTSTPPPYGVDLMTGTVFASNNGGEGGFSGNTQYEQFWGVSKNASMSAPSLAMGLNAVATITFDTTGVAPGTYALKLVGTGFGDTDYRDPLSHPVTMTINNGSITVVPESNSSFAVAGALLVLAGIWRVRRLRA